MPAREDHVPSETEVAPPEVEPAVAPETPKAEFTAEPEIPAVAAQTAASGATASELAFAPKDTSALDRGIFHWEDYKAACETAGVPEKWQAHYRQGHTEAQGWNQPHESHRPLTWTLKKGVSASKAIIDWLQGTSIADYRCAALADQLDELRDEFGDPKFDRLFGSADTGEDAKIPPAHRLRLSADDYGIPLIDQMKQIAYEVDCPAQQPVEAPQPEIEARVEDKPKITPLEEQEPAVVAAELGLEQERQVV